MRPEPPPLEPGSLAAKLLYELWTGRAVSYFDPMLSDPEERSRVVREVAVAVSHLQLRLRREVTVVVAPDHLAEFDTAMSRTGIWQHHLDLPDLPDLSIINPDKITESERLDVLIAFGDSISEPEQFALAYTAAHQVAVIGGNRFMDWLPSGARSMDMPPIPFDVVIAGG